MIERNPKISLPGTVLKLQSGERVYRPTLAEVRYGVEKMSPTGSSFVIVEREREGYAQAGGGEDEYSVEWREWGEPFVHWIAGKGTPTGAIHVVRMNPGVTRVHSHEVRSADDAVKLLSAFAFGLRRPTDYAWRDMTDRFVVSADSNREIGRWPGNGDKPSSPFT
jgi:hypothetical protein